MADQVYTNIAEGGTDGTAATGGVGGNTGGASGDYFANIQGTWTFEADAAKAGPLGYQQTLTGTAQYLRGDDPTATGRGGAGGWFYYPGGTLSGSATIVGLRTALDAQLGSLNIFNTDSKVYFYNRAGTRQTTNGSGSSVALTTGWYRFMIMETPGGSTTTARIESKLWDAAGTLLMNHDTGTTYDAGTTDPVGRVRFSGNTTATGLTVWWMDQLRWGHVATGDIGDVANLPPVISSITANQSVTAGATGVTATVVASDPDGTIASYAWSVVTAESSATPTLSGASTNTVSLTAPAAGNVVVLQCVVTDSGGATTTATTEVRVPVGTGADAAALSIEGIGDSGWTIIGGSANQGTALGDGSSTTRVESPDITVTASVRTWRLKPMATRTALRITLSAAVLTSSITHTSKVRVYQGPPTLTQITERATSTLKKVSDNSTSNLTTSDLDLYLELTAPEVAAISDWGDVRVALVSVV